MRERIQKEIGNAETLAGVRDGLLIVFRELKERGSNRIGYVSGIITSDGMEKMPENIERLRRFTKDIRSRHDFPIFSATDVFTGVLFERLDAAGFKNEDWMGFWREVLGNEEGFVTDMFMTPRWEKSRGALDEYTTALSMGMTVLLIDYEV